MKKIFGSILPSFLQPLFGGVGFGSLLYDLAQAKPSLDLRFASNRSLTDAITGANLVTFTRASSGTFVGSDGLIQSAATNEARFDHNPTTGESLGLLVEEARTNLLLRSEEFDNASWTKQSSVSVSANTTISPDGALTADTVTADQSLGIFQSVAATVSTTYTNSVYIKAGTATAMMLRDDTGAGRHIVFNPSTGVITATSGTLVSSGSQALNNGWYRYFMTYVADATTVRGIIRPNSAGSAQTFISWGAQLEAGAFPTSYIKNIDTVLGVTRAADVASITGTNFSSFYNQTEGTMFADGSTSWTAGNFFGSSDNTNNNRIFIGIASGPASRLLITTSGSSVAAITVPYALNTLLRGAGGYKENSSQFAANGVLGTEDTNCTIPTVNKLSIGSNTTSSDFFLNGTIRRLTYWPVRLPNTTLQAITQP